MYRRTGADLLRTSVERVLRELVFFEADLVDLPRDRGGS